ncbi:hypothetical protein BHAOGJBA_6041 [Methylobacterium hispanicum]|uniref:Uncharacterized protein n=1 Tax=Methylobacterium hispanicum TaxID=270350 RepID=A0AAV4ZWD4_9HYPH|nr:MULTISPECIES: hypothetical protein [Methylobacterium]GJD92487.1 hypothetical protein BHAOGJBA_6041 [Methylobacterium hispanicum]
MFNLLHSGRPSHQSSTIPGGETYVCWSRMQAEAGQLLDEIIARKERERRASGGVFLWGVGNAPSRLINSLARLSVSVPVVFSAMKTKPKSADLAPLRTVAWRKYVDENGIERPLPASSLVTSRGDSALGVKARHYALMCYSDTPLSLSRGIPFDPTAYRNAGGAGAPVGASQVTALLKQVDKPAAASSYEVNIAAWLTSGYWVRLSDPIELNTKTISEIASFDGGTDQWLDLVRRARGGTAARPRKITQTELLL